MKRLFATITAGVVAGLVATATVPADAQEVTGGAVAECPATGPGVAVCAAATLLLHEFVQMANGKQGFGPNGEIMKVLVAPVKIVDGNIKGSERESGELDKVIRLFGISVKDIRENDIWGGPNSFFRKPFGVH
jgi:hypothetical protein